MELRVIVHPPSQAADRPSPHQSEQGQTHGLTASQIEKIVWGYDCTPPPAINSAKYLIINAQSITAAVDFVINILSFLLQDWPSCKFHYDYTYLLYNSSLKEVVQLVSSCAV